MSFTTSSNHSVQRKNHASVSRPAVGPFALFSSLFGGSGLRGMRLAGPSANTPTTPVIVGGGENASTNGDVDSAATQQESPVVVETPSDPNDFANPGRMDDVHSEIDAILLSLPNEVFQGLRLEYTYEPAELLSITHSMQTGAGQRPSAYSFQALTMLPVAKFCMMSLSLNNTSTFGRFLMNTEKFGRISFQTRVERAKKEKPPRTVFEYDYSTKKATMSALVSTDEGVALSFLQGITKSLTLGSSVQYTPSQAASALRFVGRYRPNDFDSFTATVHSYGQISATYSRKVGTRSYIGGQVDYALTQDGLNSQFKCGWDYVFPYGARARALVASDGKVIALSELPIIPMLNVTFSAVMDFYSDEYAVGIGMTVTN